MLHDPKWDVYSLVGLRDWLAQQPADGMYYWPSCRDCVVGKYLESHQIGPAMYSVWCTQADPRGLVARAFSKEHTFGAALQNLDRLMAEA